MIMKRYHVISIAVLAGLIMGLSVGAKAAPLNGSYVCGNTGITATVKTLPRATRNQYGVMVNYSMLTLTSEAGSVMFNGQGSYVAAVDTPDRAGDKWIYAGNAGVMGAGLEGKTLTVQEYSTITHDYTGVKFFCTK